MAKIEKADGGQEDALNVLWDLLDPHNNLTEAQLARAYAARHAIRERLSFADRAAEINKIRSKQVLLRSHG